MHFANWFKRSPVSLPPIPELTGVENWRQGKIFECGEQLVPLGPFSEYSAFFFQDMIYFGERKESSPYGNPKTGRGAPFEKVIKHLEHTNGTPSDITRLPEALLTPFVREGIAHRLVQAASTLPKGCALLVWDPYRPLPVQKGIYDDYYQQWLSKGLTTNEAEGKAQILVSIPSANPECPSTHNTGASVDLTIVRFSEQTLRKLERLNRDLTSDDWRKVYDAEMERLHLVHNHAELLDMGGKFDEAAEHTLTRHFENKLSLQGRLNSDEAEALANRRLLYWTMKRVGFSNYHEEWWHFDCGNQFHAAKTGAPIIYGAATFSEQNEAWEAMRLVHYYNNALLREIDSSIAPTENDVSKAAWTNAQLTRINRTRFPTASKLTVPAV